MSDTPIKLAARLPKEHRLNGLGTIYDQVKRHGSAYVIMYVRADEVTELADGTKRPTLTIDHIEGLPTAQEADNTDLHRAGGKLMDWARAEREADGQAAMISKADLLATIRGQVDDEDDAPEA